MYKHNLIHYALFISVFFFIQEIWKKKRILVYQDLLSFEWPVLKSVMNMKWDIFDKIKGSAVRSFLMTKFTDGTPACKATHFARIVLENMSSAETCAYTKLRNSSWKLLSYTYYKDYKDNRATQLNLFTARRVYIDWRTRQAEAYCI